MLRSILVGFETHTIYLPFSFALSVIPVIKEKPKVVKIVKKKTVIVECHVLSKFTPECTWFKETQAVREDTRHKLHVEQVKEVSIVWRALLVNV